jgi:hypothetical protein
MEELPTTTTAAPMTGAPVPSTTVPRTALFCAEAMNPPRKAERNTMVPTALDNFLSMLVNWLMDKIDG